MTKLTSINILLQPNGVLDLKKEHNKTLKNILIVSAGLLRIAWKCMEIALIYLNNNNLRLNEISMLIVFQFY